MPKMIPTSKDAFKAARVNLDEIEIKREAFAMFVFKEDGTFSLISNCPADTFFKLKEAINKCLDQVTMTKFSN